MRILKSLFEFVYRALSPYYETEAAVSLAPRYLSLGVILGVVVEEEGEG